MDDTPAPGPIGPIRPPGIGRLPPAPSFVGVVSAGLAALDGVERAWLSAADQLVRTTAGEVEADTAADVAALAALAGEVPDTWNDPEHAALVEAVDAAAGELAQRAGELPPEAGAVPDVELPPPRDEFEEEETGGGGGGGGLPPFPPPPAIPAPESYWRALTRNWYLVVLGREPDEGGWDEWVAKLLAGRTVSDTWREFRDAANAERASRGLPPY